MHALLDPGKKLKLPIKLIWCFYPVCPHFNNSHFTVMLLLQSHHSVTRQNICETNLPSLLPTYMYSELEAEDRHYQPLQHVAKGQWICDRGWGGGYTLQGFIYS